MKHFKWSVNIVVKLFVKPYSVLLEASAKAHA